MKSIKTNFIYNMAYQILVMLLPIITSPYISRVLGAEGLGVYSYYNSLANYFLIFAMLGISNYGNRGVAACKGNREQLNTFFSEVFGFQLIMTTFASFIYIIYIFTFCRNNRIIAIIMFLHLASGFLDVSWLFFGLEEFKITVTRNIVIKLATVAFIFLFVKKPSDVVVYSFIMCLGTFLSQAYLWRYTKKYVIFKKTKVILLKKHIKEILLLFIPVLSYSVYKFIDKIMLGNMTSYIQVGFYSNAEKATNIPVGVIMAFGTVMLPRMSNLMSDGDDKLADHYIKVSIKFISFLACAISFGLIGISEVFTPVFFGQGYEECIVLIKLLSISVLFSSFAAVVRTQYLIPRKLDLVYVISTIVGAGVNLLINLILIPVYGAIGAAIGTVMAEFSLMIVQMLLVNSKFPFIKKILSEWVYVIIGCVMTGIVSWLGKEMSSSLSTLVVQVIVGACVFLSMAIVTMKIRNDILLQILQETFKKCCRKISCLGDKYLGICGRKNL